MQKAIPYIVKALGLTLALPRFALYIFYALSVPLSVLAIIHITGWDIWPALIVYAILSWLPATRFIIVVTPFAGLYFLVDHDFDWDKAAYPYRHMGDQVEEDPDYSEMSDDEYAIYKNETLLPSAIANCMQDAARKGAFKGKPPQQQINYCNCYSQKMVGRIKKEDLEKLFSHKNYNPFSDAELKAMGAECQH